MFTMARERTRALLSGAHPGSGIGAASEGLGRAVRGHARPPLVAEIVAPVGRAQAPSHSSMLPTGTATGSSAFCAATLSQFAQLPMGPERAGARCAAEARTRRSPAAGAGGEPSYELSNARKWRCNAQSGAAPLSLALLQAKTA